MVLPLKRDMRKLSSMLIDSVLPNHAWERRLRTRSPEDRVKYWALRLGLTVLLAVVILLFNIHQHPVLR